MWADDHQSVLALHMQYGPMNGQRLLSKSRYTADAVLAIICCQANGSAMRCSQQHECHALTLHSPPHACTVLNSAGSTARARARMLGPWAHILLKRVKGEVQDSLLNSVPRGQRFVESRPDGCLSPTCHVYAKCPNGAGIHLCHALRQHTAKTQSNEGAQALLSQSTQSTQSQR